MSLIIATVTHEFISAGTHCAMKTHVNMPDRTHNVAAPLLIFFYGNPCVLHHFRVTVIHVIIPDVTIIVMENHYYMPEITHYATVAYVLISGHHGNSHVYSRKPPIFSPIALVFMPDSISKTVNWCICQAIFSDSFEIVFGS